MTLRRRWKIAGPTPVTAVLVVAGCGGGDGAGNDVDLSPAEVEELAQVLARMNALHPGESSWSCPDGGNFQGTGTVAGGETARTYTTLVTLRGCSGSSEDGTTFSLNGRLTVTVDIELDDGGTLVSHDGTQRGNVNWSSGGRWGSCPVSLSTVAGTVEEGGRLSITGTLCGNTVSHTMELG